MKKLIFLLVPLFFAACEKLPSVNSYEYELSFSIQPDAELLPFSASKGFPGELPAEPESGTKTNHLNFSHIEYAVYNESGTQLRHWRMNEENEDFGHYIYDTFPTGSYKVSILTHSTPEATLNGDILHFPELDDMFYGYKEFEVTANSPKTAYKITLHRIVSRVEFKATGPVPDEVTSFHVVASGRYEEFNLAEGETVEETTPFSYTHLFTEDEKEVSIRNVHAFYTLSPTAGGQIGEIKLTALRDNDEINKTRTVQDISILPNRITRYTRELYAAGTPDSQLELEFSNGGEWEEDDEHEL